MGDTAGTQHWALQEHGQWATVGVGAIRVGLATQVSVQEGQGRLGPLETP